MAKSYSQLMKEIENLQAQADKARSKEVDGVIARIRQAVQAYGLTADDLGLANGTSGAPARKTAAAGKSAARKGARKARAGKAEPVVKFRHESGATWGGRGKRPQWLRDALAEGKTLQDFAVQ